MRDIGRVEPAGSDRFDHRGWVHLVDEDLHRT